MAMGTMATGAKEPDWQAAVDDSLSTFASVMSSADMMNGAGLLNGSKILSYPHMVMESEIYGIVKKIAGGIVVDDETLALDVIKSVGHNGTYLAERHTRDHMKEIWRPTVWDRTPYDTWLRDGKKGALDKATEIADDILANHEPEPLPEDVVAELRAIVDARRQGAGGRLMTELCPITTSPTRLALKILGDDDLRRVHAAALALLGAEGAAAEKAARLAPDTVVLGGRVFEHHTVLGARHCWLGTGGPAARVRPRDGGDPRPATAADLDDACRLADALPEVAVVCGPPVRAAGETLVARAGALPRRHQQARAAHDAAVRRRGPRRAAHGDRRGRLRGRAARAPAGQPVRRRRRPGRRLRVRPCRAARRRRRGAHGGAAGAGAGSRRTSPPRSSGITPACSPPAPPSRRPSPARPFFYVADPALAGLAAGSPAAAMFQIAAVQLAAHVGLPVSAAGMATGSHEPDWQACTQNALAALSTMAAGADLTAGRRDAGRRRASSPPSSS